MEFEIKLVYQKNSKVNNDFSQTDLNQEKDVNKNIQNKKTIKRRKGAYWSLLIAKK